MADSFKKLMQNQMRKKLDNVNALPHQSVPVYGWIKAIRKMLGMSSYVLADRLGCDRSNVTAIEKREIEGAISLETLEQVAQAMNCKLVYSLVPIESFDTILEQQARVIAKQRIELVNHLMYLEAQGLHSEQLQHQEDMLVEKLLQGDLKKLWNNDEKL